MTRCLHAHAAHPDWRMALALVAAQIDAQRHALAQAQGAEPEPAVPRFDPTLGLVYFSDRYAEEADILLADLQARWPGVSWVGGSGIGVSASGVEYFDEPALVLMMLDLLPEQFRVFSGTQPLPSAAAAQAGPFGSRQWTALVHADPRAQELEDLLPELAQRTGSSYLFGGVVSARERSVQLADGVFRGGLSGVAFHQDLPLLSRVTQGCQPVGPRRRVTRCERNVVLGLDGEPALPALLADLGLRADDLQLDAGRRALPPAVMERFRSTLVGLSSGGGVNAPDMLEDDPARDAFGDEPALHNGQFGEDTWVRHLIGLDPARQGVVVADTLEAGMSLTFCGRNPDAARRDLLRICAEIREELSGLDTDPDAGDWSDTPSREIAGAVYVSCMGRGGPHFGGDSAELQWVRHALGDVPLVGFFASGEIAHDRVYGYTGVLTVFLRDVP